MNSGAFERRDLPRSGKLTVNLRDISLKTDSAFVQFAKLYISTFAEEPYEERLTSQHARRVWEAHVDHCIVSAEFDGKMIGFGCAHAALAEKWDTLRDFLLEHQGSIPSNLEKTIFFSELAVAKPYRRRGIGKKLVRERLLWAKQRGFESYLIRTASTTSSSGPLYLKLGAQELLITQDVTEENREAGIITSCPTRIFLSGSIDETLKAIV